MKGPLRWANEMHLFFSMYLIAVMDTCLDYSLNYAKHMDMTESRGLTMESGPQFQCFSWINYNDLLRVWKYYIQPTSLMKLHDPLTECFLQSDFIEYLNLSPQPGIYLNQLSLRNLPFFSSIMKTSFCFCSRVCEGL